jgi:hypothetical protein
MRTKFWEDLAAISAEYDKKISDIEFEREEELKDKLRYLSNKALIALLKETVKLQKLPENKCVSVFSVLESAITIILILDRKISVDEILIINNS